jgi:hypothetical protein
MGYAFEMGARVIIYIMSNTEMDRVISSFIQEKAFLVCMVQSLILKISTIRLGRLLAQFPIHDSAIYSNHFPRI